MEGMEDMAKDDENGADLLWYALFRGKNREEKKDMIVGWLDREAMENEVDRYVEWDRNLTQTKSWEIAVFPRAPRSPKEEYYRKRFAKDGTYEIENVLEYHFVWDDFRMALDEGTVIRTVPP